MAARHRAFAERQAGSTLFGIELSFTRSMQQVARRDTIDVGQVAVRSPANLHPLHR
jgi:hypothetical protein